MRKVFIFTASLLLLISLSVNAVGATNVTELQCAGPNTIDTAIGCVNFGSTTEFMTFFLRWAIGIGGGIAVILIIIAGIQIITSGGDPKRLQAGKELLTSAITGVLLLVFGIFILRIVGVNILEIF